jgi:DNA invertase Pin-like site-specific DNA recombinase
MSTLRRTMAILMSAARNQRNTWRALGFERLAAMVCSGDVGAVYCIEASRLARNGRDWHHLIELCALAGTLVVDPEARTIRESSTIACCLA